MSQELNLKAIERKAWTSFYQHGLYDLFLGCLLLQLGGVHYLTKLPLSDAAMTVINLGTYLLVLIALIVTKRFITSPRVGWVQFGPRRRVRMFTVTTILFILVGGTFILGLIANARGGLIKDESQAKLIGTIGIGLFFLVFFSLTAYILEYKRLYLIGVMYALAYLTPWIFQQYIHIDIGILAWVIPAAVVLGMGLVTLRRFLHDYPAVEMNRGAPKP